MKRFSFLAFAAMFILFGCSEELFENDYNTFEELEQINSFEKGSKKTEFNNKNKSAESSSLEQNTTQRTRLPQVSNPTQISLDVNYTDAANDLIEVSLLQDGEIYTLEDFINDYEEQMSSNFTIFQIIEINDFKYKWIVNENEYCNYLETLSMSCDAELEGSTGSNSVKLKRTPPDEDDEF